MANVELKGLDDVKSMLLALEGEWKTASDTAQTRMAYHIMNAEKLQMVGDLDRPTPFSLNSLRYKAAGKPGLPGAPAVEGAAVYFDTPFGSVAGLEPEEWLGVQSVGGSTAGPRASELFLQAEGLMPAGMVWAPGPAAKIDGYGNVDGNQVREMMAALRLGSFAKPNYIVIGGDGAEVAVLYRDSSGNWSPFLYFIDRQQYADRFDFYGRADLEAELYFVTYLDEEVTAALRRLP